jgi:hypothetical protein
MHVIRHQAVRNEIKLRFACGSQELRKGIFADREILKDRFSERGAERDGVSLQPDIAHAGKTPRTLGNHAGGDSKRQA